MKAIIYFVSVISTLLAMPAATAGAELGPTYRIQILYADGAFRVPGCLTMHERGAFTLTGSPLSMAWAPQAHYPDLFLAVGTLGEESAAPLAVGVNGRVLANKDVEGSGIDNRGMTFVFNGTPQKNCSPSATDFLATGHDVAPAGMSSIYGSYTKLNNRSFQMTLGTTDGGVRERCWTFFGNGIVRTAKEEAFAWSRNGIGDPLTSFQAAGIGAKGEALGYHGVLIGNNLLHVAGIEASNGKEAVVYGYGQGVADCGTWQTVLE